MVSLIAAISAKRRALGNKGRLLWHLPEDLKRFKKLTLGHPVIMGRKTLESILGYLGKPLPGRTNIVVTRNAEYAASGALVAHSLDEALARATEAEGGEETFVIGGAELYAQALPRADRLYLTLVEDEPEADAFFPEYRNDFPRLLSEESGTEDALAYRFAVLEH